MNRTKGLYTALAVMAAACVLAGCPSSRQATVQGYTSEMLNRKRVFLLIPRTESLVVVNADAYAASRGAVAASAREMFASELRSMLTHALGQMLDSNTVLNYAEHAVSGVVTLDANTDFSASAPRDWELVKRAGREGNADFLIVLNSLSVDNRAPSGAGRGDETVRASYLLLDTERQRVMSTGNVSFSLSDPRTPAMTYERLASELSQRLPFHVREQR